MTPKPRIHVIAPFHTVPSADYSHCAFTGKAMRFSAMMQAEGYEVLEYSNEGSESSARTHVVMLSRAEFAECYPPLGPTEFHARDCVIGNAGWRLFDARLRDRLRIHAEPFDIIAHPFGRAHMALACDFPEPFHIETGVGYNDAPFGAWRVFESEAWRHYHWGRYDALHAGDKGLNRPYSWVIPNYYDPNDWPVGEGEGLEAGTGRVPYALFMGRIDECKGVLTIADVVNAWQKLHPDNDLQFRFAGQGDFEPVRARVDPDARWRLEALGPVTGGARAKLVGDAACMLMPTNFVEPFGGSGVEAMLCGTPLLASDWGAFTETIRQDVTGMRCKTLRDWIDAIRWALNRYEISRSDIAHYARQRFTLAACGPKYTRAFEQLGELRGAGWYTLPNP